MKITEVDSLLPYLMGAKFIGIGSCAICFKMLNGKVIKIYLNTYNTSILFSRANDMRRHFQLLNSVSNNTFIGPEELLIKDKKCIAYIYDYVYGKNLYKIPNITLFDLLSNYEQVVNDTKQLSEHDFFLNDLHGKNIIYTPNQTLKIIDLDQGFVLENKPFEETFKHNIHKINDTIIYSIFNAKNWDTLYFYNRHLQELYNQALNDPKYMYTLIEELNNFTKHNASPRKVRRLGLVAIEYNSYYNKYL